MDKCLIAFMLLLLLQSSYSLFMDQTFSMENNQIDVIVRTSTASIFGYILSANFIRHARKTDRSSKDPEPDLPADTAVASRLQILVATGIGLFCLLVLAVLRNVPALNEAVLSSPSALATVAQFRDIVSGCVGFLIGCPTTHSSR